MPLPDSTVAMVPVLLTTSGGPTTP
jgi:hypothetical protein